MFTSEMIRKAEGEVVVEREYKRTKTNQLGYYPKTKFLRDDIHHGLMGYDGKFNQAQSPCLQEDCLHYLLIDHTVILKQIDFLEKPALHNAIIPQSALLHIKKRNRFIYERIYRIIHDPQRHFFVFVNEFHKETYVERDRNSSPEDHLYSCYLRCMEYYNKILEGKSTPIYFLSNDPQVVSSMKESRMESDLIQDFCHTHIADNQGWLDMLAEPSVESSVAASDSTYPPYLKKREWEKGVKQGIYYKGPLHVNRNNYAEGYVHTSALDYDIFIRNRMDMNRAIDADIVIVSLYPKEQWKAPSKKLVTDGNEEDGEEEAVDVSLLRPTGKVVAIFKRNWKSYTGCVGATDMDSKTAGKQKVLFLPMDKKIPRIRIQTRRLNDLIGKRIVVHIDDWPAHSKYPEGHFVKVMGSIGDRETESNSILVQYDIPYQPFTPAVLECLPEMPWQMTEEELQLRKDFRELTICSIDPPGCTDIDDALHAREIGPGRIEIGVHIADVSHFVKAGTAIDDEAALRCTSVYLRGRRIDMLPELLGTNLCSLRSNVDRYAFSVLWEMDYEGNVLQKWFGKSVIRSKASLTYGQAQERLDRGDESDEITKGIKILHHISKILKQKRETAGALTLASPEVHFTLDAQTEDPIDVELYEEKDTNSLVAEFMLLANITVAAQIEAAFPASAMLRRHPSPDEKNFEELQAKAGLLGVRIDVGSSKALGESLDRAQGEFKDPYHDKLLRIMTTRCMSPAAYCSSGTVERKHYLHYGLASPIYTHFTSPIRRYADVIVHRQLAASLGIAPLPPHYNRDRIEGIAVAINHRHRMAQYASRASTLLYATLYFRDKVVEADGHVINVRENGVVVLVPQYGVEDAIFLERESEVECRYDAAKQTLHYGEQQFRLFTKVRVRISVETDRHQRFELKLALLHILN